jgi:hypothetical protein
MLKHAVCGVPIVFYKYSRGGISGVSYKRVNSEF